MQHGITDSDAEHDENVSLPGTTAGMYKKIINAGRHRDSLYKYTSRHFISRQKRKRERG